jgi:hypothetical protein
MLTQIDKSALIRALRILLRPLVSFCLRHGLRIQDLIECCKVTFVEMSRDAIVVKGEEATMSRVSVITGLHRRDVKRLLDENPAVKTAVSLTMRVVGQWRTDPAFMTSARKPRVLSFGTEDSEFHNLVASVSRDLNPATVLFELERVGAVERSSRGLRLVVESYVPTGDFEEGFRILAADFTDLSRSVEQNVIEDPELPHLHARTEYDAVRPENLAEIKRWLIREGHLLHNRTRNYLSQFDQDINPDPEFAGETVRVVLGTFSRVDDAPPKKSH